MSKLGCLFGKVLDFFNEKTHYFFILLCFIKQTKIDAFRLKSRIRAKMLGFSNPHKVPKQDVLSGLTEKNKKQRKQDTLHGSPINLPASIKSYLHPTCYCGNFLDLLNDGPYFATEMEPKLMKS